MCDFQYISPVPKVQIQSLEVGIQNKAVMNTGGCKIFVMQAFLALSGAHEMKMYVCSSVCLPDESFWLRSILGLLKVSL